MDEWNDLVLPMLRFINESGPLGGRDTGGFASNPDALKPFREWAKDEGHDWALAERRLDTLQGDGLIHMVVDEVPGMPERMVRSIEVTGSGLRTLGHWPDTADWPERFLELLEQAIELGLVEDEPSKVQQFYDLLKSGGSVAAISTAVMRAAELGGAV